MAHLSPDVVVTLGATALQAVTPFSRATVLVARSPEEAARKLVEMEEAQRA